VSTSASFGHPQSPTAPRRTAAKLGLALAALTLLCACSAPGMKMTTRASRPGDKVELGGLTLSLYPMTPELVSTMAAQRVPTAPSLSGLLRGKLDPYRIGPQDVLLITVWDHPEISLPMGPNRTDPSSGSVVDEDGLIYFPYVGKVKVSGHTVGEVRELLTAQLANTLRNPQMDVKVIAYRSQKVYVGGDVRNPAVYPVTDVPFTLAEAVNRAGGFLPTADDSHLLLVRDNLAWKLDFHAILAMGTKAGQVVLQDGDSLQVPNITEEPVYAMGELVKPGTIPMTHGRLTLARAISEAGGIQTMSADATSIYVIRAGNGPKVANVFHLDARNPAAMVLADKFALDPRDIIYVDAGSLVRFGRVMSLILPTISAATETGYDLAGIRYLTKHP